MKAVLVAALLSVLLLSACVRPPAQSGDAQTGSLGVDVVEGDALEQMPEATGEDPSLVGEDVDLGPLM